MLLGHADLRGRCSESMCDKASGALRQARHLRAGHAGWRAAGRGCAPGQHCGTLGRLQRQRPAPPVHGRGSAASARALAVLRQERAQGAATARLAAQHAWLHVRLHVCMPGRDDSLAVCFLITRSSELDAESHARWSMLTVNTAGDCMHSGGWAPKSLPVEAQLASANLQSSGLDPVLS